MQFIILGKLYKECEIIDNHAHKKIHTWGTPH